MATKKKKKKTTKIATKDESNTLIKIAKYSATFIAGALTGWMISEKS